MPCSTSARILSSSPAVGFRSARPITAARTEPWPTIVPMFTVLGNASSLARNSAIGKGELPSGPSMMVVTPWRM